MDKLFVTGGVVLLFLSQGAATKAAAHLQTTVTTGEASGGIKLYLHGANGREWAINSGTVGSAWSGPCMVRWQHRRIIYRATRSRCES